MRKRIMASVAAGFIMAAALAAPASAGWGHDHHDGPHDCPRHAVCFWEKPHFHGDMSVKWNNDHHCHKAPDHRIGSVVNNSHSKVKLYKDKHCDDLTEVVYAHDWDKHVHAKSWK
ncbi:peptidase inhibitor family I36 protein [Glycomyces tritici]|uniref:Peptidase inhibitor family I36 protein n=1 Tax=Glycomyces tritici TaxID=2665176 RepID=A0ABT7YP11_9ACTN|nr:peptidase inhibitor family I36 protein [Glycomyces tritici]MDN3239988.1 peptidase inhibitor family I36 protein [Glycomyces tritici]